jgi:hypothetical protein
MIQVFSSTGAGGIGMTFVGVFGGFGVIGLGSIGLGGDGG